jgi:hypothetical protein
MSGSNSPSGWVYVIEHAAWSKIGLVKIGMTSRDPTKRAAEITSVSGLIAPCRVAWCCWVEDRRAVENAVKANLSSQRIHGRRELFRTDVQTARAAIERAACRKTPVLFRNRLASRGRWIIGRRRRDAIWMAYAVIAATGAFFFLN